MDSLIDPSLRLIVGLGGWAVLTSAAAVWISKLIAARINLSWVHSQQIALEQLRAEIARGQGLLTTAIATFSASHAASHERRLQAIEGLWKAVIRLREKSPPILTMADILVPGEYDQLFSNPNFSAARKSLTLENIVATTNYATGDLESHRPFLGEYLWALFVADRAFVGRTSFLLMSAKSSANYRHWPDDDSVRKLLSAVLSEAEVGSLLNIRLGRFDAVRSAIERKMLEHVNRVISGEAAGDLGLAQAARIQQAEAALRISARSET